MSRLSELARARGLAERSGLDWVDLDAEAIDPAASDVLSVETMAETLAVPYAFAGATLKVAVADPSGRNAIELAAGGPVDFAVASRAAVTNVIGSLRQTRRSSGSLIGLDPADQLGPLDPTDFPLLRRAAEAGASDVHFVPCESGLAVRARIDGALRQIGHIAPSDAPSRGSRSRPASTSASSAARRKGG